MITKEILEKWGFNKTEKNKWIFWEDYLLSDVNTQYPYFLYATLHMPKKLSGEVEYDNSRLILHRYYDLKFWNSSVSEYYETKEVYDGLIENEEDLKFILTKTQVISAKK